MGRPKGTKNNMRSPEEKEALILEYLNSDHPNYKKTAKKHDIDYKRFHIWVKQYRESGIDGLKRRTDYRGCGNPLSGLQNKKNRTKEEELKLENLKLKIEVARLKKGYLVKGVGSKKEYVTIKDLNTKS